MTIFHNIIFKISNFEKSGKNYEISMIRYLLVFLNDATRKSKIKRFKNLYLRERIRLV